MASVNETVALEAHEGRAAGTDAERRAALHLKGRLEEAGLEAEIRPTLIRHRFALAHTAHALLAIVGSAVCAVSPPLGAALVLAAAISAALDVTGSLHLVRRLTGRRASQNVESREEGSKPGVLVLAAGYDAPAEGSLGRLRVAVRDPWLIMVGAMLAVLACAALRVAGIEGAAVTGAQFAGTVTLILLIPFLADAALSGAGSDPAGAAGVAAAMRLAEDLRGELEHFRVWLVLTGAQGPFGLGLAAWLRTVRGELDRRSTAMICLGPVGPGALRYSRREGPLLPMRANPELVRICAEIAEDDGPDGSFGAAPEVSREPRNASVASARRMPAITVRCEGEGEGAGDVELAAAFCAELARRLDAEVGPTLGARGAGEAVRQA